MREFNEFNRRVAVLSFSVISISPFDDPYGALLYMDFTAAKCKQYTWFLDLLEELPKAMERMHDQHLQLDGYPGLFYAKALCRWHLEEDNKQGHDQSTKELRQAFLRYPLTATILLDKLGSSIPRPLYELSHAQVESGYQSVHLSSRNSSLICRFY
jgi:hypothetical protein